jgi:hypothetical protein
MSASIEINSDKLRLLLAQSPLFAAKGAKQGLHESLDDWVKESRDIAPIDKGTLRRGITPGDITGEGLDLKATIESTANEGDFNYAYYIHELDDGGKNVNGEKKYLDVSAEENQEKWMKWVEESMIKSMKEAGW